MISKIREPGKVVRKNLICPVCGSHKMEEHDLDYYVKEKYSNGEWIKIIEFRCPSCKNSGDFFNINEQRVNDAIKRQKRNAYSNIINSFIKDGYSLAAIERILDIKQGQLLEWTITNSEIPDIAITFFQLIMTYPRILNLLDKIPPALNGVVDWI